MRAPSRSSLGLGSDAGGCASKGTSGPPGKSAGPRGIRETHGTCQVCNRPAPTRWPRRSPTREIRDTEVLPLRLGSTRRPHRDHLQPTRTRGFCQPRSGPHDRQSHVNGCVHQRSPDPLVSSSQDDLNLGLLQPRGQPEPYQADELVRGALKRRIQLLRTPPGACPAGPASDASLCAVLMLVSAYGCR